MKIFRQTKIVKHLRQTYFGVSMVLALLLGLGIAHKALAATPTPLAGLEFLTQIKIPNWTTTGRNPGQHGRMVVRSFDQHLVLRRPGQQGSQRRRYQHEYLPGNHRGSFLQCCRGGAGVVSERCPSGT